MDYFLITKLRNKCDKCHNYRLEAVELLGVNDNDNCDLLEILPTGNIDVGVDEIDEIKGQCTNETLRTK